MTSQIFIGLGSNLGDRKKNLRRAIRLLGVQIIRRSSLYETEPVEFTEQPWFLNAVIQIGTELSADDLLTKCQSVEKDLLRERNIPKGPRTIDLDILFYEDTIRNDARLTLPHPAISGRKFVLEPLNEIAPEFIHPVLKKSIAQLLKECSDPSQVRKLPGKF